MRYGYPILISLLRKMTNQLRRLAYWPLQIFARIPTSAEGVSSTVPIGWSAEYRYAESKRIGGRTLKCHRARA